MSIIASHRRSDLGLAVCAVSILGCATERDTHELGVDEASLDSPASDAIDLASSCDAAHPTFIGGTINGIDGRALNALIGVDHADSAGTKIDANGVACGAPGSQCCGGYSWCVRVNPTIAPEGSDDADLTRTWSKCVTANVHEAFFEIYPKNPSGATDFARYGEAVHAHQPITVGATNMVGLRLPTTFESAQGNTGGIQGYIWCGSDPAPPEAVTRVRAWSNGVGPECGIEGFSASATALGTGSSGTTYYRIAYLEGGRCFAPSQEYRFYMDVTCAGVKRTIEKIGNVTTGRYPRVDWYF